MYTELLTVLVWAELRNTGEKKLKKKRGLVSGGGLWGFVTRVAWLGDKRVFTSVVWVYVVVRLVL